MRKTIAGAGQMLPPACTKEGRPCGAQKGRKLPSSFYMICSALLSSIAVAGLFFGFLMRGTVGSLIAGGHPILHGSYLGTIIEVVRGSIPLPTAEGQTLSALLPVFLYFMMYVLAGSILCSLALTVMAALWGKAAPLFCRANGLLVLIVYGTLCVAGVLLGALRAELFSWRQLDLPALCTVALALAVFAGMAIAKRGARGAGNLLLLLCTAAGVCTFLFPHTPLLEDLNNIASPEIGMLKQLALGLWSMMFVANLLLSLLRLERGGSGGADILRFGLQFAAALALSAAYLAGEGTLESFFTAQPLAVVFLLLSPLSCLTLSAFLHTFHKNHDADLPSGVSPAPADAPLTAPSEERAEEHAEEPAAVPSETPAEEAAERLEPPAAAPSEEALKETLAEASESDILRSA